MKGSYRYYIQERQLPELLVLLTRCLEQLGHYTCHGDGNAATITTQLTNPITAMCCINN